MIKTSIYILFCLAMFTHNSKAQIELKNGLKIQYNFSGNTLDSSGNMFHGIPNNVTLGPDRYGNPNSAYFFNGEGSYITMPSNSLLNNNYSYSFWVKFSTLPTDGNSAFVISIGNWDGDQAIGICNNCPGGEGWNFISYPGISYLSGTLPKTDEWMHIVGTRMYNNLKFYINGVVTGGVGIASYPNYTLPPVAILGQRFTGNGPFNGSLDDVRIYDRVISAEEVYAIYMLGSKTDSTILGTQLNKFKSSFSISPNPSNGMVVLNFVGLEGMGKIEVLNSIGISQKSIEADMSYNTHELNLTDLNKGVYSVILFSNDNVSVQKVVIE